MEFLLNIAIRSLLLAGVAAAGLWVFRVKAAPTRHAMWTVVTAGMLLQAALIPILPAVRLRVLRPVVAAVAPASVEDSSAVTVYSTPPPRRPSVDQVAGGVYFIGVLWCTAQLVYAAWFTRRLVRGSVPVGGRRYESGRISVPVTVGRTILLPLGWREWDTGKLAAVLAHEEAHVARADWAVAAMARVNRCVFWFHPLAWWLERELARLAEQVCDDAALAVTADREKYANVLMDMARAAGARGRRVVGAVAMAKETNVEMRINRILDASRRMFPNQLGRAGWLGLSTCGALLVYVAAVVQLAPAQSPSPVSPQVRATIPDPAQPVLLAQSPAPRPPAPARQAVPEDAGLGALSGIVRDPSGARVPDAAVVIHGPGAMLTTSTNTFGEWSFSGLRAGSYSLAVLAAGFAGDRSVAIEVVGGVERKIDTNLTIASFLETVTISATGNPQTAPTAAQSESPRVGGNVQAPRRIRVITPQYPPSARDQGVSGQVVISAVIGKDGTVVRAQVTNDAPAELREAALRAAQGWTFTPPLLNGDPVEALTRITINFQLNPQ